MAQENSFYNEAEILSMGFKSVGQKVLISKKASFYNLSKITIGNNVRIDDFCILSGKVRLESNIHISAYCALYANLYEIHLNNFCGLSPKTIIFSASDDFGGDFLISPMVDKKYTNVEGGNVILEKYVQIGAGCIVLPDVVIKEGAIVGSMSLVNSDLESWSINFGIPAKKRKERKKDLLKHVANLSNR